MNKPKTPTIPMSAVKSSQVESIGHMGDTLAVKFKSGPSVYHYHGVTAAQFEAMQRAESVGSYLHQHIKPKHKFTKVTP